MADDNVNVVDPTSNQKQPSSYMASDVAEALKDFHPGSWQDFISELKKKGDSEWHLTPGEVKSMVEDAQKAEEKGENFDGGNPQAVYQAMHQGQ